MYIQALRIRNFRRLKDVRIDTAADISIFVGSNNSGKTSATHVIQMFVEGAREKFSIHDFSVDTWREIDRFEVGEEGLTLPTIGIDLWLHVQPTDLHRVINLLPALTFSGTTVGIRIEFAPIDADATRSKFKELRASLLVQVEHKDGKPIHDPTPHTLREYLSTRLREEYELQYFVLDRAKFNDDYVAEAGYSPVLLATGNGRSGRELLRSLIKVNILHAQRHLADAEGGGRAEDLSRRLGRFYQRSLEQSASDFSAMQALADAEAQLNRHLKQVFESTLNQLGELGYPGIANPHLLIKSALNPELIMKNTDGTKVHWALGPTEDGVEPPTLPDQYNGLGYKNLIYMVVELLDKHAQWQSAEEDRPLLHLIFIEEPEAHLHAQLQQVFITKILDILKIDEDEGEEAYKSQVVVTTHSAHILFERGFQPIRYFRRGGRTSEILNLSAYYAELKAPTNEFLARYMKLTHCDLFFADAAVLVEGNVERLLLPLMIDMAAPRLKSCYLSVLEIGGAFGHLFKELIEFLGMTALIITDIDSVHGTPVVKAEAVEGGDATAEAALDDNQGDDDDEAGKPGQACMVGTPDAVTSNQALVKWLPGLERIEDLLGAGQNARIQPRMTPDQSLVCVSYQGQIEVTWNGETQKFCGRTLEEAFALENLTWCQDEARKMLGLCIKRAAKLSLQEIAERIYKRVQSNSFKKTDFALALLAQNEGWTVPSYIKDGLQWLEKEIAPINDKPKYPSKNVTLEEVGEELAEAVPA